MPLYTSCNVMEARSLGFWYLGVSYESTQMKTITIQNAGAQILSEDHHIVMVRLN